MKLNRNKAQLILLYIAVLSLVVSIFSVLNDNNLSADTSQWILMLSTIMITFFIAAYSMLIVRRINPKQYIYISYSEQDKEIADRITSILDEQLQKISKYRYEINSAQSVHFGEDMSVAVENYINRSDIMIVLVSKNYVGSSRCKEEFLLIKEKNKKLIPIVMDSYSYLGELPINMSNTKALLLNGSLPIRDLEKQMLVLSKDLVKQRKD